MRQCAWTRRRAPKEHLLRLGLGADKKPFIDILGRAPGRGVYLASDRKTLQAALSAKGLRRTFRMELSPLSSEEMTGLLAETERRLQARLLELLGLARRAGHVVLGTEATVDALQSQGSLLDGWVVVAKDSSARTKAAVFDARPEGRREGWLSQLTKAQLGRVLGKNEVSTVGLRASELARRIRVESRRLEGLARPEEQAGTLGARIKH